MDATAVSIDRRTRLSALPTNLLKLSISTPRFAMALKNNPLHDPEVLKLLREHLDSMETYLGSEQTTKNRNKRLAVLRTIREIENTHGNKLTPQNALQLLKEDVAPIPETGHHMFRKHFFDHFRHLSQSDKFKKARHILQQDEAWSRTTDQATRDRIRNYIKSNVFPRDVKLEDVVHVASRDFPHFV